jgi:hypothetical protein
VANTFVTAAECLPYFVLAETVGAKVVLHEPEGMALSIAQLAARNVHNVPAHVIASMSERWESPTSVHAQCDRWMS